MSWFARWLSGMCMLVALLGVGPMGCGDEDSDEGSQDDSDAGSADGDGAVVTPSSCGTRCQAKAETCGATPTEQEAVCESYCGQSLSETEMSCLEDESCGTLAAGTSNCLNGGGGGDDAGTGDQGGGGGGDRSIGEGCTCPDTSGTELCWGSNTECEDGLTCVDFNVGSGDTGECVGELCDQSEEECPSGQSCVGYGGSPGSPLAAYCTLD